MWKLYYHDQTTFSSEDGDWLDAPAWGVLGLTYEDDLVGWSRDSNDFYINPPWGHPWGVDHWGLMDYLLQIQALDIDERLTSKTPESLEMAGVKFGRSIPNNQWQEAMRWMDKDIAPKTSWYRHERR